MNELLFLLHVIVTTGAILGALRLGKEALVGTISLLFVLANILVGKQITLFGLDVTGGDVYIIGAVLGFNVLQEYYGESITKKTIWISFFISLMAMVLTQVHVWYTPNMFDTIHGAISQVFGLLPRVVTASFIAHILAQYIQLFVYKLLQTLTTRFFMLRNMGSIIFAQLIDTILFSVLGLYGVVHSISNIIMLSFMIKVVIVLVSVPWVAVAKKLVGAHE